MFSTEHLVGRLRYETEQVVCFDVYLKPHLAKDYFVCQALLSLVNGSRASTATIVVVDNIITLDYATISKEISTGITDYINLREELGLTPPYPREE